LTATPPTAASLPLATAIGVPPTDVHGVVDRLKAVQAIAEANPPRDKTDGLACFNYLYTLITSDVLEQIQAGNFFQDNVYLNALDVEFAKRYFRAVCAYEQVAASAPRSWGVLLDQRGAADISELQFAVAGVNAHVNFDLGFAVVAACQALGRDLGAGTQRADYQKVNDIFAANMHDLRHHFETWLERDLDQSVCDQVNNWVDDMIVVGSRDAAWEAAEHAWALRDDPAKFEKMVGVVDHLVSLTGQCVLMHFRL
jgi:hypothetical protein